MSEVRGDYPKISTGHPDAGRAFANALDSSLARESKLIADFDRVTAERDAALGRVAELEYSYDELAASVGFSEARLDQTGDSPIDCANQLQQRLTAADERADMLEGLLRGALRHVPDFENADWNGSLRHQINEALKPAGGGGDDRE